MQFIDLQIQQNKIRGKIECNIQKVLDHGKYIMGPEIGELEKQLNQFIGTKYAISCASGTDALLLSLLAHDVKPGDLIITTPFTFIATAEVISLLGATPLFVDIAPDTFNIHPDLIDRQISHCKMNSTIKKLKGIIAVDLFGLPADYEQISSIARSNNLFLIEDAAQSFGAIYHGKQACSLGDIGCASFFPAKPLGCYGDGGMCFTNNSDLAEKILSLRVHGKGNHKYENIRVGCNSRLDTIQAAILLAKFEIFQDEIKLRQRVASRYNTMLKKIDHIQLPIVPEGSSSIWAQYSLLAESERERDRYMAELKNQGIPTAVYYPKPLHLQTAFKYLSYKEGDLQVCEDVSKRIFSIPFHPYMTEEDQQQIADALSQC